MQKHFLSKMISLLLFIGCLSTHAGCKKGGSEPVPEPPAGTVQQWFTRADQSILLQQQPANLRFEAGSSGGSVVSVDEAVVRQEVEGFGYTLTGSSALLIQNMAPTERASLLQELFGKGSNAIGVSYLRLSLGASDLSPFVFSYNDLPAGDTDPELRRFSLAADTLSLLPVLKEILAINPNIKLMASPWSAPGWMKSNNSSIGGSLLPIYYGAYANYFVKYIQAMKGRGINIDAVTVQNEPQHGGNNPSMVMTSAEQADFVKNHLGPAFRAASISAKIIIWDHNCDNPAFPINILNDAAAKAFVYGSAFHLYAGDITALSQVKEAHPDRALYFTEQWTGSRGNFAGDFMWHIRNVMIGSMRNWSKTALEWNLANDPAFGPHTPGGCTECKGAVTINGSSVTRNVSYYIVAQLSKFVPSGSVVISSESPGNIVQVAFKTPDNKRVLVVMNDQSTVLNFSIKWNNQFCKAQLPANTVCTYIW